MITISDLRFGLFSDIDSIYTLVFITISGKYLAISKPRKACDHNQISKVWIASVHLAQGVPKLFKY